MSELPQLLPLTVLEFYDSRDDAEPSSRQVYEGHLGRPLPIGTTLSTETLERSLSGGPGDVESRLDRDDPRYGLPLGRRVALSLHEDSDDDSPDSEIVRTGEVERKPGKDYTLSSVRKGLVNVVDDPIFKPYGGPDDSYLVETYVFHAIPQPPG